jgi:hypothetical protein
MPHYIPLVSRSEDLDDNRPGEGAVTLAPISGVCVLLCLLFAPAPVTSATTQKCCRLDALSDLILTIYVVVLTAAEEKSLNTKMVMKLKGTFKIRLFEGTDWTRRAPVIVGPGGDSGVGDKKVSGADGKGKGTVANKGDGAGTAAGGGAEGGGGKAVRFRKDELLKDLTAPQTSSRPPLGTTSSTGSGGAGKSLSGKAPLAGVSSNSSRPPRSSRPLFEVLAKRCCVYANALFCGDKYRPLWWFRSRTYLRAPVFTTEKKFYVRVMVTRCCLHTGELRHRKGR